MMVVRAGVGLAAVAVFLASPAWGFDARQVLRPPRYTLDATNVSVVQPADLAAWIWMPGHDVWGAASDAKFDPAGEPVSFFRFRRDFVSDGTPLIVDVSADERFVLLLDGIRVACGPHRGCVDHWYYQTYDISGLESGRHRLEAVCWQLGVHAPLAQLSWRGGFLLKAEGAYDTSLTTGKADWEVAPIDVVRMSDFGTGGAWGAGSQCEIQGTSFLAAEPAAEAWRRAKVVRRPIREKFNGIRQEGWKLFPTERLDPIYEPKTPGRVVNVPADFSRPIRVEANSELDLWWDLGDYYCAYPEMSVSGGKGAVVTWGWTESLRDKSGNKGDRNAWRGKEFSSTLTDTFRPDGREGACFTSPWWRCGRWCRIAVKTATEPLEIDFVRIAETRYPFRHEADFESDDPSLSSIAAICRRALEECAHETLVDCPYYEQQMYPGDSRVQLLTHYALTSDDSMARFALSLFDFDRRSNGMVAMNFPTRATQESATYTMCWVLMHRDYLMWRDNAMFLRQRMPGVRSALMGLALFENEDGLLQGLPGWSFMDWVDAWMRTDRECRGVAPDGDRIEGAGSLNNLLYLLALQAAAEIDAALGEPHLSAHWRSKASALGERIMERFWDDGRGLVADTARKDTFSEHGQCLSILAGLLAGGRLESALRALERRDGLSPVSSYFAYYLFEAFAACGRVDLIRTRLEMWKDFLALGAKTAFEKHEIESRSDCHGWSACPLYFYHTAFAGVRPAEPFFRSVRIAPAPAGLRRIRSSMPSPLGVIKTDMAFDGGGVSGVIELPAGLSGMFLYGGREIRLNGGQNEL